MKFYFLALLSIVIICCNHPNKSPHFVAANADVIEQKENLYPEVIDSLRLRKLFDLAKWTLYCVQCDDTARFRETSGFKPVQFGFLDLRFKNLLIKNDSIEFHFSYFKDSVECNSKTIRNFYLADGVLFKKEQLVAFTSKTTLEYFWEKGNKSRFEHPLQPEVINFLNKYNTSLNHWFYNEAIKRGVVKIN